MIRSAIALFSALLILGLCVSSRRCTGGEHSKEWPSLRSARQDIARRIDEDLTGNSDRELRVRAASDPQFSVGEAREQANDRLNGMVLEAVMARAGDVLPERVVRRQLPQLLLDAGVRRGNYTETTRKPYGIMYRQHLTVVLPDEVVSDWVASVRIVRKNRVQLQNS